MVGSEACAHRARLCRDEIDLPKEPAMKLNRQSLSMSEVLCALHHPNHIREQTPTGVRLAPLGIQLAFV